MKTILQETMAEVVGLSTRKQQDWFDQADEEIQELLEKKCSCHNHLLAKPDDQAAKAVYKTACSTLQAKLRTMQNDWWTGLAERIQQYANLGDMHAFYEALKAFQQKSISKGEKQCSISSRICSPTAGREGLYHRTPGMQSLSLCTKTREKNQTVQTIEASFCSLLQAKSWLASC